MKSTLIRHVPTALETKHFDATGAAVICRAGGWATHRIHWAAPSSQQHRDETSEPLVKDRAYLPPNGTFTEFWISCERLAAAPEDILLEVVGCATPVITLNAPSKGFAYHQVASGTPDEAAIDEETNPIAILYRDNVMDLGADDTAADSTRRLIMPRGFIGGGVDAEGPIIVRLYGRLTSGPTSKKPLLAEWDCNKEQLGGRYGCRFERGGRANVFAQGDDTVFMHYGGHLLWPMYGLELLAFYNGVNVEDIHFSLQEIVPL